MSRVNIPDFLRREKTTKKTSAKRNWMNLASFLSNDYGHKYDIGVTWFIPNTHLEVDESEYENLSRREMIDLMLSLQGAYAIVTWRELSFKLIDAKRAYAICSEVLQINRVRKNSRKRTNKKDVALLTPLDVFERYKEVGGRYRKVKK